MGSPHDAQLFPHEEDAGGFSPVHVEGRGAALLPKHFRQLVQGGSQAGLSPSLRHQHDVVPRLDHPQAGPGRPGVGEFLQVVPDLPVPDHPGAEGQHVHRALFQVFLRGQLLAVVNLQQAVRIDGQGVQVRKGGAAGFLGPAALDLPVPQQDAYLLPLFRIVDVVPAVAGVIPVKGQHRAVFARYRGRPGRAAEMLARLVGDEVENLLPAPYLRLIPDQLHGLGLRHPPDFDLQGGAGVPPQALLRPFVDEFPFRQVSLPVQGGPGAGSVLLRGFIFRRLGFRRFRRGRGNDFSFRRDACRVRRQSRARRRGRQLRHRQHGGGARQQNAPDASLFSHSLFSFSQVSVMVCSRTFTQFITKVPASWKVRPLALVMSGTARADHLVKFISAEASISA